MAATVFDHAPESVRTLSTRPAVEPRPIAPAKTGVPEKTTTPQQALDRFHDEHSNATVISGSGSAHPTRPVVGGTDGRRIGRTSASNTLFLRTIVGR